MPLREIGSSVNEISEGAIANLLSIFHVVGAGIDAACGKWRVVFECMGRLPNIPSNPADEVRAGSLLLLGLIPEVIRGFLRNFRGSAGVRLRLTRQKPKSAVRGQKVLRLLWDTAFLTAGECRYKPVRTGCLAGGSIRGPNCGLERAAG